MHVNSIGAVVESVLLMYPEILSNRATVDTAVAVPDGPLTFAMRAHRLRVLKRQRCD